MSMPIQRQSDAYGIFDSGTRWDRDRSSTELPKGLAALVNTSGPRITGGLLDTRQAGYGRSFSMGDNPFQPGWGPADHGGHGPDGGPRHPDHFEEDYEEDEDDPYMESLDQHDPDRYISADDIREARRGSGRLPFDRTAAGLGGTFGLEYDPHGQGLDENDFWGIKDRNRMCTICGRRRTEPSGPECYHGDRTAATIRLAFDWRPYDSRNPRIEGHEAQLENGHNLSAHIDHSKPHEGWSWGLTVPMGTFTDQDGNNPQQMLNLVTGGGLPWAKINGAYSGDHLPTREHAIQQAQEAYMKLYPMSGKHQSAPRDSGVDYDAILNHREPLDDDYGDIFGSPHTAAAAPAPVVGGHVFMPGHLVKTMWRGEPRNGVVTGTDGPYVKVYYDDHQHLYEDPQDLQLR